MTHALHFGIYPTSRTTLPSVDGHSETFSEHEIDLTFGGSAGPVPTGLKAYVSGSWACWGPADQSEFGPDGDLLEESEGDRSLHVVFKMDDDDFDGETVLIIWDMLRMATENGRLLDYAVVTTDDWSQQEYVVGFRGNPFLTFWPVGGAAPIDPVMHREVEDIILDHPNDIDI